MITAIEVVGFQSIRHAELQLSGWTSLVGESDVGKSAIVRAITAAMTNWRGDHFIRHGLNECAVMFKFDDGTCVRWVKRRGKSGTYDITPPHGEAISYEKTGGEVPAEVAALLNVSIDVAGDAFTPGLQQQHDPPFLFADTPRRRAQTLGEFDGSNLLMLAEGALRRSQREQQAVASGAHATMETIEQELTAFEWVDGAVALLEDAKTRAQERDGQRVIVDGLRGYEVRLHAMALVIEDHGARLRAVDLDAVSEWLHAAGQHDPAAMVALARRLRATAPVHGADVTVEPLDFETVEWMIALRDAATVADGKRQYDSALLEALEDEQTEAEAALRAVVGATCPVCGSPLTAEGLGL